MGNGFSCPQLFVYSRQTDKHSKHYGTTDNGMAWIKRPRGWASLAYSSKRGRNTIPSPGTQQKGPQHPHSGHLTCDRRVNKQTRQGKKVKLSATNLVVHQNNIQLSSKHYRALPVRMSVRMRLNRCFYKPQNGRKSAACKGIHDEGCVYFKSRKVNIDLPIKNAKISIHGINFYF